MNELDRFKEKAISYRQALANQPTARLLELYPILWYLEKHRKALGRRKSKLRIVDLMSGSGFLSENLYKLGYTDLHAVEFCEEMYKDSSAYNNKVRLHFPSSFDHLDGVLDQVKPDVIISLASFHHLLIYDANDQVDKLASQHMQSDVVDICMRALPDQGILLIADLIDTGVTETPLELFKTPVAPVADELIKLGLDKELGKLLSTGNSLHGISSLLHRELGTRSGNQSLNWFRGVVDKTTAIGHKDIAISSEFLERVASYRPVITKYACPWVFKDRAGLDDFVYRKFAFGIARTGLQPKTSQDVAALSEQHLGIRSNHGVHALGWNLGIVLLGKRDPFSRGHDLNILSTSLLAMTVILVLAVAARYTFDIYAAVDFKDIFVFTLTLPLGIILGNLITKKKLAS